MKNNKDPWSKRKNLYSSPVPRAVEKPKIKWKLLPILWVALKKTCMLFGAVTIMVIFISAWSMSTLVDEMNKAALLPNKMVLYMELDGDLGDLPKGISIADPFSNGNKTLKNFVDALERAKSDSRVMGVYAKLEHGRYSLANIQEMRAAIKDFRLSGKFAYIYSPSYSNGLGGYYLASSFDEIWMQPMGSVMVTGINAQMPFLRGILDKIGLEPQFFQRKEYKNAYESLTNEQMSKANREAMDALIADIAKVLNFDISADRGFDEGEFKALVDKGLLISDEAMEAGLIDVLGYADKLVEHINMQVTGDVKGKGLTYVNFDRYMNEMLQQNNIFVAQTLFNVSPNFNNAVPEKTSPRIALIYAVGAIMDDNKGRRHNVAAADEIAGALMGAAYDDNIDGVVLRVDSPGGSPVASETILRAVQKVKEEGKSVTVSMGNMAASGGYWISTFADQIFLLPSTITGSIGVLGGKISAKKLWENLGINWDSSNWGENSAMFSMNKPFSESEEERMNIMLDNIYDGFVARVAKGRGMSEDEVEKIARGRVWAGISAIKVGLADQFGGLKEAIDYAAVKVGARGHQDVDIVILPRPLSNIEKFIELLEGQVVAGKIMASQAKLLETFAPVISEFMVMQDANSNIVYNNVNIR